MLKLKFIIFLVLFFGARLCAESTFIDSPKVIYQKAFDSISQILTGENPSFEKAVFISENAFLNNEIDYQDFENNITYLSLLVKGWAKNNTLNNYIKPDSLNVLTSNAIFSVLKDTIKIKSSSNQVNSHLPFVYDFDDFEGKQDWTKMFVTKLLVTKSGNCHSLPYLYKILGDELKMKNYWLSLAPNHIYIKNHCQKIGWYNTELTSGEFPVDAWITASGFISMESIRSGIYMDTLSNKQAVAQCVLDLAKGYERKTHNYIDSFIIRCCDLVLKYHPTNINAIIYKAETLKRAYQMSKDTNPSLASSLYNDMEGLYLKAMDLGYKEMPEKMYRQWLESVIKQKDKYKNEKASSIIKKRT